MLVIGYSIDLDQSQPVTVPANTGVPQAVAAVRAAGLEPDRLFVVDNQPPNLLNVWRKGQDYQ